MKSITFFFFFYAVFCVYAQTKQEVIKRGKPSSATFGGGCFWCTEAVFDQIKGVDSVIAGYAGGTLPNPTYKKVSTGKTDYAEVVRVYFQPSIIHYKDLVEIFIGTHDPTTVNRQGVDVGKQYRSVIFYENEEQQQYATEMKKKLARFYNKPIVTSIEPLKKFYVAEEKHQDFYRKNKQYPYSRIVIKPKIDKLLDNYYPYIDWK